MARGGESPSVLQRVKEEAPKSPDKELKESGGAPVVKPEEEQPKEKVQPTSKQARGECKGVEDTSKQTEERKPLPRRREEVKVIKVRSRTPKRQKEKEKRRRRRRPSTSTDVSGSEVGRKKREDHASQKKGKEIVEKSLEKTHYCEGTPFEAKANTEESEITSHTRASSTREINQFEGDWKEGTPRSGWRGRIPYSSHPRWSTATNKGVRTRRSTLLVKGGMPLRMQQPPG